MVEGTIEEAQLGFGGIYPDKPLEEVGKVLGEVSGERVEKPPSELTGRPEHRLVHGL